MNIFINGIKRSDYDPNKPSRVYIDPLLPIVEYNTVEGLWFNGEASFLKEYKKTGNSIEFTPHIRYGFSNTHLNAWATLTFSNKTYVQDMDGESFSRSLLDFRRR